MTEPNETHEVDPGRLARGKWSQEFNATVGEGDIAASYCADTIGLQGKTRKPFIFHGDIWVNTGNSKGVHEAYRLVPIDNFNEASTTYSDKTKDCLTARNDPNGFYHGVAVIYYKDWFVLCGPPAFFMPGQVAQPELFGVG